MLSWFKKERKKIKEDIDFSKIAVDFHSHLIPNVDDGVGSIEECLEILQAFKSLGYTDIYTSPHIMSEGYVNSPENLTAGYNMIISDPRFQEIEINFNLIAEYYLDEGFEKLLQQNNFLTINEKYILVEFSFNYDFPFVKDYIYRLVSMGYKPILAHIERYNFIETIEEYDYWKNLGLEFQLNLGSLVGVYGENVKKKAQDLIEADLYDYVSSDAHGMQNMSYFGDLKQNFYLDKLIRSNNLKNKKLINASS